jgi:hypothetical protein
VCRLASRSFPRFGSDRRLQRRKTIKIETCGEEGKSEELTKHPRPARDVKLERFALGEDKSRLEGEEQRFHFDPALSCLVHGLTVCHLRRVSVSVINLTSGVVATYFQTRCYAVQILVLGAVNSGLAQHHQQVLLQFVVVLQRFV